MADYYPPGTTVVVEDRRGPGCVVGCLALIGLLVVIPFILFSCGILSLGAAASSTAPPAATPSTDNYPTGTGVRITSVEPGGNAEKVGLLVGDRIIGYMGEPVNSPEDLTRLVDRHRMQFTGRVGMTIIRNGQQYTVEPLNGTLGVTVE